MLVPLLVVLSAVPLVPRGSTIAVDPIGRGNWVVDEETDSVALIPAGGEPYRISVGAWPEQLVLEATGRLFVSCRQQGRVDVIAPDFTVQSIDVGVEPGPLFLDEANHRLFVGLVTARELVAIDTRSLAVVARRQLDFEPAALELMPNGLAVLTRRGGEVGFVSPSLNAVGDWWVRLPSGDERRRSWQGLAMARAGSDLVVIHTTVDTGIGEVETSGLYGGGVSSPVLTVATVLRNARPIHTELGLPLRDVTGIAVSGRQLAIVSRGNGFLVRTAFAVGDMQSFEVGAGQGLSGVAFDGPHSVVTLAAFDR